MKETIGAFSNNTLTLNKLGGGSVDINFPDMNKIEYLYTGGNVTFPCTFMPLSTRPTTIDAEFASGQVYRRRNISGNTATVRDGTDDYNWYLPIVQDSFQATYAATFASTGDINGNPPFDLVDSYRVDGTMTMTNLCLAGGREDDIYAKRGSRFTVQIEFMSGETIVKCIGPVPQCYSSYTNMSALLVPTETTVVSFIPSE